MKLFLCIIGLASALADDDQLFQKANDQFTAKMFQEVVRANEGKSVILSAFSVLPPLAQLTLASTGPSHGELLTAIGLPDDDTIKKVFSKLKQQLNAVKGLILVKASRIYIAQDAKLNKKFAALSKYVFGSDYINIDFSKRDQSVKTINNWVEAQTSNKIKDLLPSSALDQTTRSVLVNAIYFKGIWNNKFNSQHTRNEYFHVSKSKTIKVPTMHLTANLTYGESAELDAKLLELPYNGSEASFLIVLPNKIDGLTNLEKKLKDPSALNKAIGAMSYSNVEVSMPKFKIETETNLKNVLQKMKVNKLFSPSEAKLDKLLENETNMYIGTAIQKTFIEVNEEGTEAAVANAFILYGASRPDPRLKKFKVNRPFYFEVRLRNTALFNGAVVNL